MIGPRRVGGFEYYFKKGLFWFRLFGYGPLFRHTGMGWVPFSERNGLRKMVRIGPLIIRWLYPGETRRAQSDNRAGTILP